LEYIDISNLSKVNARKLILEREQYYLDLLEPEPQGARSPFFLMFLVLKTGGGPRGLSLLKVAGNLLGYKH